MEHSEEDHRLDSLRKKIIGLGETSHRKSYYPQLQEQLGQLSLAMHALQESEEKYRTLIENVNIGILRSEPWEGGHFIQTNPALCKMLGFNDEKELMEIPVEQVYLHPEERSELLRELKQSGKIKDRKVMFKRRDGSPVLCSITFSAQYDSNGNVIFLDGVAEDITEKEEKEAALRESEEKYRTLVENVNIGIIRSEPWKGGHIIQANPTAYKMLGFNDEKELLDRPVEEIYRYPEERSELLRELKQTGKIKDRKIMFKRRDGVNIMASVSFSANYDSSGNLSYLDGVIEDITEKEKMYEALRQINSKLNLLSSITRHDIINQVMIMEGYLYLVMERIDNPELLRMLERMKASVRSIDRHIMFTKDYEDVGIHAPQWVNLREVVTSAMVPVDKALINMHMDVKDYLIFTDPMIKKVFYNLANNVIKHSKASNLTITTVEEKDKLLVVFQDDGIGIKDKSKLFKKGNSTSGYGLFLSKEILSITGIGIRETGLPGEGARFELIFSPGQYKVPSDKTAQ
ncbi:MAG: sensory histidine kinase AtoS [Methanomethylovorans sp. PtaU1.Bin073]|jgi:PAS domain S-box-containing protein|nr:MAG: sensory histidine kinase AtoS [Methanomethylovorans sp. PtaU1.Bin073]